MIASLSFGPESGAAMGALMRSASLSVVLVMAPGLAWAAGDAARGQALTQVWCANCHVVDSHGDGKDTAPPLPEVARRGAPDQIEARTFLNAPHPPMPNFDLARQQSDDIIAYLNSLARR
jgi:mono/diheme cytochrome c family protein